MNAFNTAIATAESFAMTKIPPEASWPEPYQPMRIPVFRSRVPAGYVECGDGVWRGPWAGPWVAGDFLEMSVEDGVVHLSGEVNDVHGVLALRRIAAAMPGATAIVDDLWVSCE